MELSPLVVQWREDALHEGRQEGQRVVVENLLRTRFGTLDEELSKVIEPLLQLPRLGVYPPAPQLGAGGTFESV